MKNTVRGRKYNITSLIQLKQRHLIVAIAHALFSAAVLAACGSDAEDSDCTTVITKCIVFAFFTRSVFL